uniref:Uncharacterized protein n=1 Tax=Glycine max TaxID=3847 RepID=A0A0R0LDT9_SOYBN
MTKAIIEAVSGCACEDLDLELLQRKIQNLFQRKKYFLVLDDVWDDEQDNWQKVALIMGTMSPRELSMLFENDCWELFKHQVFGPNEEIVKKYGGTPLVVKTLGGLLRFKREEKEWIFVKDNNLLLLIYNENSIMLALRLSYLNLPIKLKQCFAFCAIFGKDERIWKQNLIELWMANGFISSNKILDVEDVGDGVWQELYWRSFFQDIEKDGFGIICCIRDLLHSNYWCNYFV